jgi:hypothetical protein
MTKVTAALLTLMVSTALSATSMSSHDSPPWKETLAKAKQSFSQTNRGLGLFSQQLTAACDNAKLKDCDKLKPAEIFPTGYRIIPRIDDDKPAGELNPYKDEYSLETLESRLAKASRKLASLSLDNGATQTLVDDFITLREEISNIQLHLNYHDYWQGAAITYANWFAGKRPLSKQAAQLLKLKHADAAVFETVRNDFSRAISGFMPASHGVSCHMDGDMAHFKLELSTDIESATFRNTLQETVEKRFSGAATQIAVKLDVELRYVSPDDLYRGHPPAIGSSLDANDHIPRFGGNKAVITTGAPATHAFVGQRVELGGAPTTRRTLAHEIGHLLGFNDVYLRNFEAHENPTYGVIYSEWKGISNDLMGNNAGGEVTPAMRDTLISYYCTGNQ